MELRLFAYRSLRTVNELAKKEASTHQLAFMIVVKTLFFILSLTFESCAVKDCT